MRVLSRLIFIVMILAQANCGSKEEGGIVDNGNRPKDPDPTEEVPVKKSQLPPTQDASTLERLVLNAYIVRLPNSAWLAETNMEAPSTTLTHQNKVIKFTPAKETCAATPETNVFGMKIYWCSSTQTIFATVDNTLVQVEHPTLDDEITAILRSVRKSDIFIPYCGFPQDGRYP